jgi:hypothetical protein
MKKIVLKYGLISGAIVSALMNVMVLVCVKGNRGFEGTELIGYSMMVLAFLMVFFGIRSYRDTIGNGVVSFGRAFQVGLLITLITSVVYVVVWEIVYFTFVPDFIDVYSAHVVDKLRASGATAAAVTAKTEEMAHFKKLYANPFFNVGMTFMEIFPVGLLVTLVSAGILRRKGPAGLAPATAS